jgi:hypothetical protein
MVLIESPEWTWKGFGGGPGRRVGQSRGTAMDRILTRRMFADACVLTCRHLLRSAAWNTAVRAAATATGTKRASSCCACCSWAKRFVFPANSLACLPPLCLCLEKFLLEVWWNGRNVAGKDAGGSARKSAPCHEQHAPHPDDSCRK